MRRATAISARVAAGFCLALTGLLPASVFAAKIKNPVAVFSGLDKITGRTTSFDVYVDETVQFGALQVTPRVCYSHDETEAQKIDGFVEVDEITLDRKIRRIFTGWMFASAPGLNAVDHPIYDVWLTGCKQSSDVPAPNETKSDSPTSAVPDKAADMDAAPRSDDAGNADPDQVPLDLELKTQQ